MALTQDQIHELKKQLKSQVQHLPADNKAAALQQIESLSPQALEAMIKQQQSSGEKTIFRMIVEKEVDSVEVGENPDALAVLDINPISRGHILVIPKKPVHSAEKIPENAKKLASELEKKILSNLKAKKVLIEKDVKFGEAIISLIPVYDSPVTLNSQRKKAEIKSLEEVKTSLNVIKIEKKPEIIKITKPEANKTQLLKLKRRVP